MANVSEIHLKHINLHVTTWYTNDPTANEIFHIVMALMSHKSYAV